MQRNTLIWIAFCAWLCASILSLLMPYLTPPSGEGFTRGMNRILVFLAWQALAIVPAIAALVFGSGHSNGGAGLRWLARVPIIVELALISLIVALIIASRFSFRPVEPPVMPSPTTTAALSPRPLAAEADATTIDSLPIQNINDICPIFGSECVASH